MPRTKIDGKLNIVIPLEQPDGSKIYVHSVPLSRLVFEEHFAIMAQAFSYIYSKNMSAISGPRVAMLVIKEIAGDSWSGPTGVENTLVAEMIRLSNVLMPVESSGWQLIPLQTAIAQGHLDEDEIAVVLNNIAFFTVNAAIQRREVLNALMSAVTDLWGIIATSLSVTAYRDSLLKSTPVETGAPPQSALMVPTVRVAG
jgi:hypothetical protein